MSTRVLLDEMFSPRIATELVARDIDCLAVVADPAARESSDADLLRRAADDGRALVTDNVVDFDLLRRQCAETDDPVPPLIYTSNAAFPRDRRFIGRLVDALDHACDTDTAAGGCCGCSRPRVDAGWAGSRGTEAAARAGRSRAGRGGTRLRRLRAELSGPVDRGRDGDRVVGARPDAPRRPRPAGPGAAPPSGT